MVGPNVWAKKWKAYGTSKLLRQPAECQRHILTIVLPSTG